jgi:predicted HD phosphohydrolase
MKALSASEDPDDRKLAQRVADFVRAAPFVKEVVRQRQRHDEIAPRQQARPEPQLQRHIVRPGPDRER